MSKGIRVSAEDCDPSSSEDRSRPSSAYLVEYNVEVIAKFDMVMTGKIVEIFDEYYDKYKKDLVNITQAEGRITPKLWNPPGTKKEK